MPAFTNIVELDEMITRPCEQVREALRICPGPITVLGAGGKMGFHLCRMLQRTLAELDRKDQLLAVSRFSSAEAEQPFQQAGIATHTADLSQDSQVRSIPVTPLVFFLAGVKFGTANKPELLTQMNTEMPKLIASHFAESSIVAMSTGCVYSFADQASGGSKETDATAPPGEYAQSCLDRETAFMNGSMSHRTKCCLIRLNYSIDLRYGVLMDIAQQVWQNRPVNIETGYVNVIWQGDAIKQIIQAATLTQAPPQILNITGSETLRVRDIATGFGQRFNRAPKFSGVESTDCWLSNNAKACELFGQPSTSIEQMMDWTSDWLISGGPTLNKPTHFQTRDGHY
ncbi:MAG: NAD-dependent epimerase/dehydratase family protein [Rubripirellula sp.]